MYTASRNSNVIVVIDSSSLAMVGQIAIPPDSAGTAQQPIWLAITQDAKFLYAATNARCVATKQLSVIDTSTNIISGMLTFNNFPCPGEIAFSPDSAKAYVANPCSNAM